MPKSKSNKKKPVLVITVLYLAVVFLSFAVLLATAAETAMSGIFLVVVTIPWAFLLTVLQDVLQIDSTLQSGLFLLLGGMINAGLLYGLLLWIISRKKT